MAAVFVSLVPVFLTIVTGAVFRRLFPAAAAWRFVEWLVYYVLFPLLLVATLARADLGRVPVGAIAATLALAVVAMSALCLALRPPLAARQRMDGAAFTSVFQGCTRWQTSVALAVAANLYGDQGLALAAVGVVAMIPLINVINVWVLAHFASPEPPHWTRVAAAIARNPLIWGCVVGAGLYLAAPPIPGSIYTAMDAVGGTSLPLGLLLVGSGLNLAALLRPRVIAFVATSLKLVVMPALAVGLGVALGLGGTSLAVVACCASVPSASNAYVLARQMGGDAPLMAEILTLQTLVAMATMPVAIAVTSRL